MKHWYQSKTIWLNAIAAIAAVLGAHYQVLPESWQRYALALVALLNVALRLMTNQPIAGGEREQR